MVRKKIGQDGFISYVRDIHSALCDYVCTIEDLLATDYRAAARMLFKGIHQNEFFGVTATRREIAWAGAPFFTTDSARITELWVLGDVDSVKAQLSS